MQVHKETKNTVIWVLIMRPQRCTQIPLVHMKPKGIEVHVSRNFEPAVILVISVGNKEEYPWSCRRNAQLIHKLTKGTLVIRI